MKRYSNRALVAAGLLPLMLIGLALAKSSTLKWERNSVDDNQKIERLKSIVRETPAVANRQVVDTMREAAKTRRDDALLFLIKALAYNFDPDVRNESRTPDMLLPAIQLIKENYGDKAVPALYREALNSTQTWYRNRIAVAVRAILSPVDIEIANAKFLRGANAPDFQAALTTEKVELFLARSDGGNSEKLEELRKAKPRNGNL